MSRTLSLSLPKLSVCRSQPVVEVSRGLFRFLRLMVRSRSGKSGIMVGNARDESSSGSRRSFPAEKRKGHLIGPRVRQERSRDLRISGPYRSRCQSEIGDQSTVPFAEESLVFPYNIVSSKRIYRRWNLGRK